MWFLMKEIMIFLGDMAIDLARMKKEKRKELLDEAKEYFRDLFRKRQKK